MEITQAETTNQIRDEKVLQQRAIAQGYQLRDAELDPQDSDRETYLYTFFAQNPANSQWYNLCASDKGQATKAMLLSGSWDETGAPIGDRNVTVACTSGVLAKCVRWGYKPWKTFQGVSLRDYHQACTRMARADYCGNGNSHTQDGTLIDVYDKLGIQQPEVNSKLTFEAAWDVNGALLLNHTRYPETLAQLQQECPQKLKQIYVTDNQSFSYIEASAKKTALIFNDSLKRSLED